jgi:cytochrome c oxidase assembly protein Cox11
MTPERRRNLKVVVPAVAVIGAMLGLVAYSPTLYRLFCAATGFGGTTRRASLGSRTTSERVITVRFDSNVAAGLPWRFEPAQREVKIHLGEQQLVFFTAENLGDEAIVGHATFNVIPETTGIYFVKIQCFCFDEERLNAHQKVDMPVVFFVDPSLANDPDVRNVDTITLSYTFFRSVNPNGAKDLSRFAAAGQPDQVRGEHAFVQRCAACHGLDANKSGPMLGHIFDRKAASVPGYAYSPALTHSDLNWTADNLDRWLTNPRKVIPGVRMPVRVPDAATRRDIIAYLKEKASGSGSAAENSASQPAGN